MHMEQPQGSRRIRARRIEYANGSDRSIFRIEDASGRVLRKIQGARDAQEALALYWRRIGAAGLEAAMGRDLERRIRQARAGGARTETRTPELPFETEPPEAGTEIRRAPKRGRPPRATEEMPQTDLFGEQVSADPPPVVVQRELEPEPATEVESVSDPEPYALDPQTIMLQRVDARNLRPTDRPDSYLYHVTNGPDADTALRSGLVVSISDPMILSERQGVAYWLSVLAEDYDYILDGPADFVVLRLRRMAVEALLEHDLHASRSAGCPCYLLTGGAALRDRT